MSSRLLEALGILPGDPDCQLWTPLHTAWKNWYDRTGGYPEQQADTEPRMWSLHRTYMVGCRASEVLELLRDHRGGGPGPLLKALTAERREATELLGRVSEADDQARQAGARSRRSVRPRRSRSARHEDRGAAERRCSERREIGRAHV